MPRLLKRYFWKIQLGCFLTQLIFFSIILHIYAWKCDHIHALRCVIVRILGLVHVFTRRRVCDFSTRRGCVNAARCGYEIFDMPLLVADAPNIALVDVRSWVCYSAHIWI